MRPHIAAVYAFARLADDFADEGERPPAERVLLLDEWLRLLHQSVSGDLPPGTPESLPAESTDVFLAVAHTIQQCGLAVSLFEDLLSAFRQDVDTKRYRSWEEVLDYCRRSADPVGRIVLGIAGYRDERLSTSSDALCTALQLTNFWQDLARDWRNGRLYVPLAECTRAGADVADLDRGLITPAWKTTLTSAAQLTATLFERGRAVCDGVGGRLKVELRLTWLGGRRILERLEASGFDVFANRPTLGAADLPLLAWRAAAWRRR
jgi:squalene synthase HpnC